MFLLKDLSLHCDLMFSEFHTLSLARRSRNNSLFEQMGIVECLILPPGEGYVTKTSSGK